MAECGNESLGPSLPRRFVQAASFGEAVVDSTRRGFDVPVAPRWTQLSAATYRNWKLRGKARLEAGLATTVGACL